PILVSESWQARRDCQSLDTRRTWDGTDVGETRRETSGVSEGAERPRVEALPAAQTQLAGRRHRVEHAGHDLSRACAARVVGMLRFEQLGVRQNDPELVVQAVKEKTEIGRFVHGCSASQALGRHHHEASLGWKSAVRLGSRHSVSTKMRTEPPAVRTYSI